MKRSLSLAFEILVKLASQSVKSQRKATVSDTPAVRVVSAIDYRSLPA